MNPRATLTWQECEGHYSEDEPQQREDQAVTEESPEVYAGDLRSHYEPEGRNQITHLIADAEGKQPALSRHPYGPGRFDRDEALNHPLSAARRNEDGNQCPCEGRKQGKCPRG